MTSIRRPEHQAPPDVVSPLAERLILSAPLVTFFLISVLQ